MTKEELIGVFHHWCEGERCGLLVKLLLLLLPVGLCGGDCCRCRAVKATTAFGISGFDVDVARGVVTVEKSHK